MMMSATTGPVAPLPPAPAIDMLRELIATLDTIPSPVQQQLFELGDQLRRSRELDERERLLDEREAKIQRAAALLGAPL
jgi:hypothetical protein